MEIYREDRKVLIIGFQISLIVHLMLYILLKLMPDLNLKYIPDEPIEININIQQIEKINIPQKVNISSSQILKTKESLTKQNFSENKLAPQSIIAEPKNAPEQKQKEEKPAINIDENNLSLIDKITSAKSVQKEGKESTSAVSVGESLSSIFKNAEGDALSRKVIYRPQQIKLQSEVPQPSVRVKLYIAPSGDVVKVQLLTLTADPSLNREIVNYLLRWKFNPIAEEKIQYAVLTLEFSQ